MKIQDSCPVTGFPCSAVSCAKEQVCWQSGNKLDRETMRTDPVIDAVRDDLHRRSQLGIQKYGTTLHENSAEHRARLEHIYNEVLDAANYLKWAMMQMDNYPSLCRGNVTGFHTCGLPIGGCPGEAG